MSAAKVAPMGTLGPSSSSTSALSSAQPARRVFYPPSLSAPAQLPRAIAASGADFCPQPNCLFVPHPHTAFRQPVAANAAAAAAAAAAASSSSAVSSNSSSLAGSKTGSPFSGGESTSSLALNDSLSSLSLTNLGPSGLPVGGKPRNNQVLYNGVGHARTNLTKKLSFFLLETIRTVDPQFEFNQEVIPRRILTKPSEPSLNGGYDNIESDFILIVNDILGDEEGHKYQILELLGHGTFGQVVRCRNIATGQMVAVKVIKNKPAYFKQSLFEVNVLELLNHGDSHSSSSPYIIKLVDHFIYAKHLCMAFELLGINLYELLKFNQFRGLSLSLVRIFTAQILEALVVLHDSGVIHCDLKPENILLKDLDSTSIKVIDFGSACMERNTLYTYIQSRFYRSPEVLLGLPYSSAIDMWSLGCICAELFLGLPLFPGSSEYNQISRIVEMRGLFPNHMIESSKHGFKYFQRAPYSRNYALKSIEQFSHEYGVTEKPSKRYFEGTNLEVLIQNYPCRKSGEEYIRELDRREVFYDFLKGVLCIDPHQRWTPRQAQCHPFLRGERTLGNFKTPPDAASKEFLTQLLASKQQYHHHQHQQQHHHHRSHSHSQSSQPQVQSQPPFPSQPQPLPQQHQFDLPSNNQYQPQQQQQQLRPQQQQQQQQPQSFQPQQQIFGFQPPPKAQQDPLYLPPSASLSGLQIDQRMAQQPPAPMSGVSYQKTVEFTSMVPAAGPSTSKQSYSTTSSSSQVPTLPPFLAASAYGQAQMQGLNASSSSSTSSLGSNMSSGSLAHGHSFYPHSSNHATASLSSSSYSLAMDPTPSSSTNDPSIPPGLSSFVLGTSPSGHSYLPGTSPSYNSFSGWQPSQMYLPQQQQQPLSTQQQHQSSRIDLSKVKQEVMSAQRILGAQPTGQWENSLSSSSSADLVGNTGASLSATNTSNYPQRRLPSWGSSSSDDYLSLFSVPNDQSSLISSSSSDLSIHMDANPEDQQQADQVQKLVNEYWEYQSTQRRARPAQQTTQHHHHHLQQQQHHHQHLPNGAVTGKTWGGGTTSAATSSSSGTINTTSSSGGGHTGTSQRGARGSRGKPVPSGSQEGNRAQPGGGGNPGGEAKATAQQYRPPPPPQHTNHRRNPSGGRAGRPQSPTSSTRNRPPSTATAAAAATMAQMAAGAVPMI